MFARFFQSLFGRKNQGLYLTNDDLDRMDVAYEEPLTALDCEKVMVEEGVVVGTTATLDFEDQSVIPTSGKHPAK
jgi:hypothetical protein